MAKKSDSKSRGTKKPARARNTAKVRCVLESPGRRPVVLEAEHSEFARLAMKWNYLVRNRYRWAGSDISAQKLGETIAGDLAKLLPDGSTADSLRGAQMIQVSIPYEDEDHSWPARVFPWEFVISRATKRWRTPRSRFIVVRHLECGDRPPRRSKARDLLFVESCPGRFADEFTFDDERKLLESRAVPASGTGTSKKGLRELRLVDPTLAELKSSAGKRGAVHVSGIDAHKGREILEREGIWDDSDGDDESCDVVDVETPKARSKKLPYDGDGLYLAAERAAGQRIDQCIDPQTLAEALNAAGSPLVVTFNVNHSAARLAALAVADGAGAAIGFQDDFDDALTEHFYAVFYEHWCRGASVLDAFWTAYDSLGSMPRLQRGSGIVLWSRRSLIDQKPAARSSRKARPKRAVLDVRDAVKVRIDAPERLNYSRLHNGENVFDKFRFYNFSTETIRDIHVAVDLQVGPDTYSYFRMLDLEGPTKSIEDEIRMALSWEMAKSLCESVRTTLRTRVECQGTVLHEETYALDLLPVNEWVDDDQSGPWLPSFVLPRDRIVAEIIDRASRYLRVLADDADAGFDGYQQIRTTDEPDLVCNETKIVVDAQVKAVWFALLHDFGLGYVNPPPTFTDASQRLRRPSDVVDSKHGTCIDLALLFASCLEYLGINAVIFLLDGHAFPGYWREERNIATVSTFAEVSGSTVAATSTSLPSERRPWRCGKEAFDEVKRLVRLGQLVPIETVSLTARESFDVAVEQGVENLGSREEFHSVLDVAAARQCGVTPLPI